ncbi:MAG: hypothetical protein FWC60_07830 [Firmicutes bacterium]|nr:hypothetical protein [Bacillota bacterium]
MLEAKKFNEIFNALRKRERPISVNIPLPADILHIYNNIGDIEINGDFKFMSYENAIKTNTILHNDFKELGEHFWVFAENGQGDIWLIDIKDILIPSRVYFYDHDIEDYSDQNMLDMNITLEEWFVLGDLISQSYEYDYRDDNYSLKETFQRKVLVEMEKISTGLSEIYPFSL